MSLSDYYNNYDHNPIMYIAQAQGYDLFQCAVDIAIRQVLLQIGLQSFGSINIQNKWNLSHSWSCNFNYASFWVRQICLRQLFR